MNNEVKKEDAIEKKAEKTLKVPLKKRTKRIPFREQKKIGIKQEAGYHYRLVNDEGDRIDSFLRAGYEHIEAEVREGEKSAKDPSQMGKYARQSVGNGLWAEYLRIPLEYYKEDQEEKQALIDETDKAIGMDKLDPSVTRGKVKIDYGPLDEK